MQKISWFHQFILHIQSILESRDQTRHTHPKKFQSTFNLCKFVSTCKKSGYFIELFWRCDLKQSCNLIGWEHFSLYLRNQNFSQIWDLCRNTVNNINFHYRTNSIKINDNIFQYIQKTCFWYIFGLFSQFLRQKQFFWKYWLCHI